MLRAPVPCSLLRHGALLQSLYKDMLSRQNAQYKTFMHAMPPATLHDMTHSNSSTNSDINPRARQGVQERTRDVCLHECVLMKVSILSTAHGDKRHTYRCSCHLLT